jgi:poly(A) polymerase
VAMDERARRRLLYRLGPEHFRDLASLTWANQDVADDAAWSQLLTAADAWVKPVFPLVGADVLTLGIAPGPKVGELLATVEQWWVAGDFRANRAAALARLSEIAAA